MSLLKSCAIALLSVALPLSLHAEGQPGPGMMGPGGGMMAPGAQRPAMGPGMASPAPRPFAGVQFNEEQKKRINEMMEQERQAHQKRVAKMQQYQQQLQKLYLEERWDAKAITQLYEKMHAEQRKTIAAMAEARNKVYDLMSEEQREQMRKFQQQQMQRYAMPPQPQPQPQQ
jgi:Spy/CpxP family protein refolding chaperone